MAEGGATSVPPGLAVAQDGLRLELAGPARARAGHAVPIRLRIVADDGAVVRRFDVAHTKRMHLIVVGRDLTGFQHLHPRMRPDGTWEAVARLRPGATRLYADFTIDGEQRTLGTDLLVAGRTRPAAIPPAATVADAGDGLTVALRRDGERLAFDVRRGDRVVNDELQPYLGAKGHLVMLRTGDLAYLHAHPDDDALAFEAHVPSAGTYRLWVQFRVGGRVHTAAFTQEVSR